MRVVVGIPVFNEMGFIDMNVSNMLTIGFDDIVYLDDCSTDGSYEKLLEYSKKHSNIHVFKNGANSIACKTVNRWKTLAELCRGFEPDWIMVRASDQEFSFRTKILLRPQLEFFLNNKPNVNVVCFPVVHLWRSKFWYRADKEWGYSAENPVSDCCWRGDSDWDFKGEFTKTGMHRGCHRPNYFGGKNICFLDVNFGLKDKPIVVLHYGLCSHDHIAKKLDFQMHVAEVIHGGNGFPMPSMLSSVIHWRNLNGYKIAHEFDMNLLPVKDIWYDEPPNKGDKPKVQSLYNVIHKYNIKAAEEYKDLFYKTFEF